MTKAAKLIRIALLTLVLSSIFVIGAAAASLGAGTVTASALRLRAQPSTSSSILATAGSGSQVVVLSDAGSGWYKVDYNTIAGYMYAEHLNLQTSAEANLGYAYINTGSSALNLRAGAGTDYQKLASIPGSSIIPIGGISNGWYKVAYAGTIGYVSSDYVLLVKDTGTRADGASASAGSIGSQIIALAKQYLGCPYVYGASGPNKFDCSGFTKYIFAKFGYTLYRTATGQLSNGAAVSRSALQAGDLVFFKYNTSKTVSHVGIYIGGGKFIHASSPGYDVCISDMSSGHYSSVFAYARRIV
jgi:cell wall-associated NlpC family hydrolase